MKFSLTHRNTRLLWLLLSMTVPLTTMADPQPNSIEACWNVGGANPWGTSQPTTLNGTTVAASYATKQSLVDAYNSCTKNVAIQCANNQINDQCFLQFGTTNDGNGNITGIRVATDGSGGLFVSGAQYSEFADAAHTVHKTIYIDDTHNNFHVRTGRFLPFATLVGVADSYDVKDFSSLVPGFNASAPTATFTAANLNKLRIAGQASTVDAKVAIANDVLIIVNPLGTANNQQNQDCDAAQPYPNATNPTGFAKTKTSQSWVSPISSGFTANEIASLVAWVQGGGSLLLVADHYPFPGAASDLAQAFGFSIADGYGFDPAYNDVFLHDILHDILPNPMPGVNVYPSAENIMGQQMTTLTPAPASIYHSNYVPDPTTEFTVGGVTYCGSKQRTVKDDLKQYISVLSVQLGAEINTMVFWAGQPATANLAPVQGAQPVGGSSSASAANFAGFADGDGWLVDHPIVRGFATDVNPNPVGALPYVTSFTGTSFTFTPATADTSLVGLIAENDVLRLGYGTYNVITPADDAYVGINSDDSMTNLITYVLTNQLTPAYTAPSIKTGPVLVSKNAQGNAITPYTQYTLQGATATVGAGRFMLWGEAGMWTAQMAADGQTRMGFNNPIANNNQQFILNAMHWLDGTLTGTPGGVDGTQLATAPSNTGLAAGSTVLANTKADMQTVVTSQNEQKIVKNKANNLNLGYQQANLPNAGSIGNPGSIAGGGGGCSISNGRNGFDPTLPLLVLIAMGYPMLRRRGKQANCG